jgi:hypothetical protein
MRPQDLVFWLDALPPDHRGDVGVLCRRHADTMIVPRGWTLDDLRDPDLHLFRPPAAVAAPRTRSRRDSARPLVTGEQLELGGSEPSDDTRQELRAESEAAVDPVADPAVDPPWSPNFDEADDLDGLLSARSPLLARAFRTADSSGE